MPVKRAAKRSKDKAQPSTESLERLAKYDEALPHMRHLFDVFVENGMVEDDDTEAIEHLWTLFEEMGS